MKSIFKLGAVVSNPNMRNQQNLCFPISFQCKEKKFKIPKPNYLINSNIMVSLLSEFPFSVFSYTDDITTSGKPFITSRETLQVMS